LPEVEITFPAADAVLQGEVTITVTASDNVGVKRVEYYIAREISPGVLENYQIGVSAAAPYSLTFATTSFDDGEWTISAYAVDTSDNYSLPSQVVINIDNDPEPDLVAPTLPDNALSLNGVPTVSQIPLKWLAGSDNVAVTRYRVTYADNPAFTGSQTKIVGNVLNTNITGLAAENDYWHFVQAGDAAGNWSTPSNVVQAATAPAGTGGFGEGIMSDGEGVADSDGEGIFTE
jgi:chitinase